MALFNFVDFVGPVVPASYLNQLDLIRNAVSATAAGAVTLATTQDNTGRGIAICRTKPAMTSRSATTVLANDPDLQYVFTATGAYWVRAILFFSGTATGTQGISFNLNYSGIFAGGQAVLADGVVNAASTGGVSSPVATVPTQIKYAFATISVAPTADVLRIEGVIIPSTLGTLAIAWAQNSSSANATNLLIGSSLAITQVS